MMRNIKIIICFLFITLFVASCSKSTRQLNANGKTYLALGDSYTIGQGVKQSERFPFLFAASLRADGIMMQDPRYIATTGWTTADLQAAIAAQNPATNFDLVTLLIGVNDQYQGLDTLGYRTRFSQLLNDAIRLAGNQKSRVFVLSIPDYSATPFVPQNNKFQVSTEIDWFNKINSEVTLQAGVTYLNITPSTREAATDNSLLASDQLHYSAKEHQRWVNLLQPRVTMVLR